MEFLLIVPILIPAVFSLFTLVIKKIFKNRNFRQVYVFLVLLATFLMNIIVLKRGGSLLLFNLTQTLPIRLRVDEMTILFNTP